MPPEANHLERAVLKLSVVATLYKSAAYIEEFCTRVSASAQTLVGNEFEIVLVNDGSPDNSLDIALARAALDPHIKIVDLSRNFGHHKAIVTGLSQTRGEFVYLIDIDLEEQPEWLIPFHAKLVDEGCDMVYGVQRQRKGGWFERISGAMFYKLFAFFTGVQLPPNWVTAAVMTRRFVDALVLHDEREMFLGGLYHLNGFDQRGHLIDKASTSSTTYTLGKRLSLLVGAVTAFSTLPLMWIFYTGLLISLGSFLSGTYIVLRQLIFDIAVAGWVSVIVSVWFLGGLSILFIGVIGIYLAKTYSESKRRPYTTIRNVYPAGQFSKTAAAGN